MKVLVTGGAGYVGSVLVPILLGKGHDLRVVDSLMHGGQALLGVWGEPGFDFVRGDVRDQAVVEQALRGIDAVVHLAAIVGDPACARQPELAREVNLEASLNLLRASKSAGVKRFLAASTCSNYGKMADPDKYVDETSELTPVSLYARTKVQMEEAILNRQQTNGLCATSMRFATIFGVSPRMRFDLTVNEFTMELATKKKVTVFGEQFWRPYIHVRDAARAVATILEADPNEVANEVFNIGATRQNHTKKELVEMINKRVPDMTVDFVQKQEDPRDYRVTFSKIQNKLGFDCEWSVEDGIDEVIELVEKGIIQDFQNPSFRN